MHRWNDVVYAVSGPRLLSALKSAAASVVMFAGSIQAAVPPAGPAAYPERPIRLLVGFAPGGTTDITARAIAAKLGAAVGQEVVIDNRPGAAGNIATEIAARSMPDGHTVLMGTIAALAINPALYGDLAFDPVRDFSPITQAVIATNVLVVQPTFQATNVKGLIERARVHPGKTKFGSLGVGSTGHLAGELFSAMAKVKMDHVALKIEAPALTEIIAGEVQCAFVTAATALPLINLGKLRPLGVTTLKRAALLPDVPTIAEQGLPGFDANTWYGLLAPAKTPRPIVDKLNAEVVKILHTPEIRLYLLHQGLDPAPTRPEEFSAYIRSEVNKWSRVVRDVGASSI